MALVSFIYLLKVIGDVQPAEDDSEPTREERRVAASPSSPSPAVTEYHGEGNGQPR